jgi:ABC-type phosphate transport system substrate-binding protein
MSTFGRRKPRRTGIRAALLTGATVAAFAVAGIGAGSASATVSCTGTNITGEGSSLQKVSQLNVWIPTFESEICNSGTHPTVTYLPEGSGAGLKAWAANTGNSAEFKRTRQYIGTDDAPTEAQINNIKAAAGGGDVLTIPVAQTAIAVVVNPPEGCTVTKMTGKDVERAFRGVDKNWSEISTASGTCSSPITRVVRKDGSGTTYQFKNYLSIYNSAALPCLEKTWKEIEPIENSETSAPNTSWPEGCKGIAPVVRPAANGGGEEVKKVNATPGSIGYAALPDAQANSAHLVELQNNGQSTEPTFGSPVIAGEGAGKGVANCGGIQYVVPKEARNGGVVLNADWSKVFGANASVGGSFYPLCALTYDLAFHGYKAAGFKFNEEVTVQDYIEGYLVFKGQEDLVSTQTNYAPLPEVKNNSTLNVLSAARRTAAKIQP